MKPRATRMKKSVRTFEREYRSAWMDYVRRGEERALGRAYELGRQALAEKRNLIDLIALHHQVLADMLEAPPNGVSRQRKSVLAASRAFLAEFISPYEMAHRAVQDAVAAVRQLNERLEEEIKRIAYSVHDEAGQMLVAVHLSLAGLARKLPPSERDQLKRIDELLNRIGNQLRRYSHELRPAILDDLGWIPALRSWAAAISQRSKVAVQIDSKLPGRLPPPAEIVLYRVAQEALNNAARHARARRVRIRVRLQNRSLRCSISDDGCGFDSKAVLSDLPRKGLGLVAMQDRLHAIGGTLSIDSAPGRGTTLLVLLPIKELSHDSNRARR